MQRFLLATYLMLSLTPVWANSTLIERGLEAYRAGSADRAMQIWLAGSILQRAGRTEGITQQLVSFRQLCGRLESWSPLKSTSHGPQVTETFYVMHFEQCPVFARFMIYRRNGVDTLVRFNVNSSPEAILEP